MMNMNAIFWLSNRLIHHVDLTDRAKICVDAYQCAALCVNYALKSFNMFQGK